VKMLIPYARPQSLLMGAGVQWSYVVFPYQFLPRDVMHKRGLCVVQCPYVCPSVRLSVTFVYSVATRE